MRLVPYPSRLGSPTDSAEEALSKGHNESKYDAIVVRLTRASATDLWSPHEIFRLDDQTVPYEAPGALGRNWRDPTPLAFDVGNHGAELHLAFRIDVAGYSRAAYYDCVDTNQDACDYIFPDNLGWTPQKLFEVPQYAGEQFQPALGASPTRGYAALTWYQQTATNGSTFVPFGAIVGSEAPPDEATPAALGTAYTPCTSTRTDEMTGNFYFGDYEASVTPFDTPSRLVNGVLQPEPLWITTYARSTQCLSGGLTNDQFVESVKW